MNWDADDGHRVLRNDSEPLFRRNRLTLLNRWVQLRDLDGKSVNPILQRVHPQIEHVCLIEELSEYVFSMFTFQIREYAEVRKRDEDIKEGIYIK